MLVLGLFGCAGRGSLIEPRFEEISAAAGVAHSSPSFGAVFCDLDNDGDDDLLVNRHGRGPVLYLNHGGSSFTDATSLLPRTRGDRHGLTAADLDNDGDRDVVLACGGADGRGQGCASIVIRNLLADTGELAFDVASDGSGLAEAGEYRARCFLPVASSDGSRIDLYLSAKKRPGFPNRYYQNTGSGSISYGRDDTLGVDRVFASEGMDLVLDLDRDGDQDMIIISEWIAHVFRRHEHGFELERTLATTDQVCSLACGDLDNDGLPDLFVGTGVTPRNTDRLSHDGERIHFYLDGHNDSHDRFSFATTGAEISVDLLIKPGLLADDPSDIFLGAGKSHPPSRAFTTTKSAARGTPEVTEPGTFLWFDPDRGRWNLELRFAEIRDVHDQMLRARGIIRTGGLSQFTTHDTEEKPEGPTTDLIFFNSGGRLVSLAAPPALQHDAVTSACAMADLNNDGLLDIVGIRGRHVGAANGDPFIVLNRGEGRFDVLRHNDLVNPADDLARADQLIAGDVDRDGWLDLFITNGSGLQPGNLGPFLLFRNTTAKSGGWLGLDLVGTVSNRDAIGAQVELWRDTESAGAQLMGYRELGAGFNRSQSSRVLHFGTGSHGGDLRVKIRWPSGLTSEHRVEAGRYQRIEEPVNPASETGRSPPV